jgi:hypothetical protein
MFNKIWKKGVKSMAKYPWMNAWAHLVAGVGIGILFARPLAADHPMRWGIGLIIVAVLMHFYMTFMMKK